MNTSEFCRVWGYATYNGAMVLTTSEEEAKELSKTLKEYHGKLCVKRFKLVAIDQDGKDEIALARRLSRTNKRNSK